MHVHSIPLTRLAIGQVATIHSIAGHPDHVHRLEEFGLRGGTRIEMFRSGSPCIVRAGGNKICLRPDWRLLIEVLPVAAAE